MVKWSLVFFLQTVAIFKPYNWIEGALSRSLAKMKTIPTLYSAMLMTMNTYDDIFLMRKLACLLRLTSEPPPPPSPPFPLLSICVSGTYTHKQIGQNKIETLFC